MSDSNDGWTYRERIYAAGGTLLAHLVEHHGHSDAATWAQRIADGQVRLDGAIATAGTRLQPGQCVEWRRPPWSEPAVPLGFALLALDEDVVAVAKPAGLPATPAGGFLRHTLLARVRRRFPEATPMHRLGRGTSGVMLFARTERARRTLAADWRAGAVERSYRALVEGRWATGETAIDVPIGPVPHPVLGEVWAACATGREARTWVRLLAPNASGDASVVAVRLGTGRPHQIRIHLAAAGHPLVGDPLYGPGGVPRPGGCALPGDGGYRLHADRIVFPHPASGARVVVDCAPPPVLRGPA
jgi:23S rRNA pseudouridine1911/1915/1917 synthase